MMDDLRRYNGGAREGSGRPQTVAAWHQFAVRLPEDMARWLWRQPGSNADVLRRLVREAMEKDAMEREAMEGQCPSEGVDGVQI